MQEGATQVALLNQLLGPLGDEGLTSSALQEYLHKVDVRREEVLLTLYATVAERYAGEQLEDEAAEEVGTAGTAAPAGAAADAVVSDADFTFSSALARLQEQAELAIEDGGVAAGLAALAAQHAAVLGAMRETAVAAASVRVAAEMQQRLADFDASVAAGSYSEAAWIAVELQRAVGAVPGSEETAAAVAARVQPLQQHLLSSVSACVTVDPATHAPALVPSALGHSAHPAPGGEGDPQQQQQQQQGSQQQQGEQLGAAAGVAATAASLAEAWKALGVLGLLPQALQPLAAFFLEHSVGPILSAEREPSRTLSDSPAGSVASSNLSRATAAGGGRGGNSTERQLYKALKALTEQVLGGSEELAEQIGALLWPPLAAAYLGVKLKPIQPQSDAEVEMYSRRSSLGAKLEQKAVALHLLSGDRDGPITRHIKRTLNQFLNARRNRFIAAARDLLLSRAAQEAVVVGVPRLAGSPSGTAEVPAASRPLSGGASAKQQQQQRQQRQQGDRPASSGSNGGLDDDDPLMACGQYAVSKAAQGAVNLMRDALAEAVRSGNTALAQAMCGAVVDVAASVVALAPPGTSAAAGAVLPPHPAAAGEEQQQQQQATVLPYPAALRHNDCHYIYQALCSLPYQFSPRLQQLVHRNVNFVSPAMGVRQAGQECLDAMVRQQEAELLGLVDELRQFSGLDADGQAGIRCRKTVQQLLHAFRRLGSVLRPVLAPGVLVEVAARLIQAVCGRIMDDIMCLPDISVDESEQIPQILEPLTAGLHDAVLPSPPEGSTAGAAGTAGASCDELANALHERTPAVMKLRELCELLDIRLVEIRRRWQDGRLQAIGFSAHEVAHLVRSLFENTDLRRDFLLLLESEAVV